MWTASSGERDQSAGATAPSCCHAGDVSEREFDERPWGNYQVLEDATSHKVKRLEVAPGHRLSYQRHEERAEHWYVIAGEATVTLDGVDHVLGPGQAIDIPRGSAHRVANRGAEPLTFIEVQVGDYFGEQREQFLTLGPSHGSLRQSRRPLRSSLYWEPVLAAATSILRLPNSSTSQTI